MVSWCLAFDLINQTPCVIRYRGLPVEFFVWIFFRVFLSGSLVLVFKGSARYLSWLMFTQKKMGGGSAAAAGAVVNGSRGRFITGAEFTEQQQKFIEAVTNGKPHTVAAVEAGYSDSRSGWRLLRVPAIAAAIKERQAALLCGDLSGVALSTLRAVMIDETAPAAARVSAAKWTLEAAGHGLAAALGSARLGLDVSDKPLSALSLSELEAMAEQAAASVESIKRASGSVLDV